MLELMDVLLRLPFGSSRRTTWIWQLCLIRDGSDGNLLLRLLVKTFLGETSVLNGFVWSVVISAPSSLSLVSRLENSDSARINSLFSAKWDWGFQWTMRYQFICYVILWVHGWGCCWCCWKICSSMSFGTSWHEAARFGWFRDGSNGAILLLRLLLRLRYVEKT